MKLYNEKFIAANDFRKYLESHEWYEKSVISNIAVVWRSKRYPRDEILQPIDFQLADYNNRVNDVIAVLSKTQQKPPEKIIADINTISSDVISIRVIHDDVENGEIPFADGVDMFTQAKLLLTSAAKSLINPRKVNHGGKNHEAVSQFFDSLKLAQTEIGSYVINVVAPIYFNETNQDDHCNEPFSRSVSARVVSSVDKLVEAVSSFKESKNLKYFEESINAGVNESLCSAIIGLSGSNKNRSIEISIKTSPYAASYNIKKLSIKVPASDISIIQEAKNYFSGSYSHENYELSGIVIRLFRKSPNSGTGTITIEEKNDKLQSKSRKIVVELTDDYYDMAIKAHEIKGTIIKLKGRLVSTKKKLTLCDVTDLSSDDSRIL